jgi:lipopolysaccharide biosynthesis glycosyltransferase
VTVLSNRPASSIAIQKNKNILISHGKVSKSTQTSKSREPLKKVLPQDYGVISEQDINFSRISVCTICNNDFVQGAKVLIYSFLEKNKWFSGDINIFYCPTMSPLSEDNMEQLSRLYEKIFFRKVNLEEYSKVFNRFKKIYLGTLKLRFLPSLLTYEAFELIKEYDRVLYLDSDMVVLDNLYEIFTIDKEVIVTPDAGEFNLSKSYHQFNGGFLLLKQSPLTTSLKNLLIAHSIISNKYELFEQSMMNEYLGKTVYCLDSRYNCLKRCFPDTKANLLNMYINKIKIIHYVGAKPWNSNKSAMEKNYKNLERLWTQVENNIK